jgi:hypothetical protein
MKTSAEAVRSDTVGRDTGQPARATTPLVRCKGENTIPRMFTSTRPSRPSTAPSTAERSTEDPACDIAGVRCPVSFLPDIVNGDESALRRDDNKFKDSVDTGG